jgi:hypothetical protein
MKTRRWATLAVALLTAASPAAASPAARPPAARDCSRPEPVLSYASDHISVSLSVDYAGCRWWHGKSVNLSGLLERQALGDPVIEGIGTATGCIGEPVRTAQGQTRVKRVERCRIVLMMGHDNVEVATYSGEFVFPWRGGSRKISFSYDCSSTPLGTSCD